MSRLEAHVGFFRLLLKGIFSPYVLWPFDKKLIFELVMRIRTRNYTVYIMSTTIVSIDQISLRTFQPFLDEKNRKATRPAKKLCQHAIWLTLILIYRFIRFFNDHVAKFSIFLFLSPSLGTIDKFCCLDRGCQKLQILCSKKKTKYGRGGQKSPILRKHSL